MLYIASAGFSHCASAIRPRSRFGRRRLLGRPGLGRAFRRRLVPVASSDLEWRQYGRFLRYIKAGMRVNHSHLNRVELRVGKVLREHWLLDNPGERMGDLRQGPDVLLYVMIDCPLSADRSGVGYRHEQSYR